MTRPDSEERARRVIEAATAYVAAMRDGSVALQEERSLLCAAHTHTDALRVVAAARRAACAAAEAELNLFRAVDEYVAAGLGGPR